MKKIEAYIDLGIKIAQENKVYLMYLPFYEGKIQEEMKDNTPVNTSETPSKIHLKQKGKTTCLLEINPSIDYWKPIENTITNEDILSLENELNIILPKSYKAYLQYQHYYEIFYDIEIILYPKPIHTWNSILINNNRELKEQILDKGYFAIGKYSDYGTVALQLGTDEEIENEVVLFDYSSDSPQKLADNFLSLLSNILQEEAPKLVALKDWEKKMHKIK